jgi:hypothetical protein
MQAQAEVAETRTYAQRQTEENKAKPPTPPQVPEALSALEVSLEENLKMAHELENRLTAAGVLQEEPAVGNPSLAKDSPNGPPTVPMVNRVNSITATSRGLFQRYRSILRRLEL